MLSCGLFYVTVSIPDYNNRMIVKITRKHLEGSDFGLMHFPYELKKTAKPLNYRYTNSLAPYFSHGRQITAGLPILLYENNTANLP
jgi:hypothetical protein